VSNRPPGRKPRRPSCFVYVLGCRGARGVVTYVGWTVDLAQRLEAHNGATGAKFTRGRRWHLLYAEGFHDRAAAMSREWHLKRDRKLRTALRQLL
jgi:putative endonuclease